jgi:hypothetical protein
MSGPVERKVTASSYTAAASGLVLWTLGTYVFKGEVPDVIVSWVYVLVPALATFAAGYLTKHTIRLDVAPEIIPTLPPAAPAPPKEAVSPPAT